MSWARLDSTLRQPSRDRRRVETKQCAPLDVRDPPLGDQPSDVSHAHPEVLGHVSDVNGSAPDPTLSIERHRET